MLQEREDNPKENYSSLKLSVPHVHSIFKEKNYIILDTFEDFTDQQSHKEEIQ